MLEEAHEISPASRGAFLNHLEDKLPEHVIWMFVTTEPHVFEQPLLSRFQPIKINPHDQNSCSSILKRICKIQEWNIPSKVLKEISIAFDNNPRYSITGLESVIARGGADISPDELIENMDKYLGYTFVDSIIGVIAYCYEGKVGEAYRVIRSIPKGGEYTFLTQMVNFHLGVLDSLMGVKQSSVMWFARKFFSSYDKPKIGKALTIHKKITEAYSEASKFQVKAGFLLVDLLISCRNPNKKSDRSRK